MVMIIPSSGDNFFIVQKSNNESLLEANTVSINAKECGSGT